MKLAKAGQRVAVVEGHTRSAGAAPTGGRSPARPCATPSRPWRTIGATPSSSIRSQLEVEFPDLLRAADGVINEQVRTRYRYYQRNRVEVVFGQARFVDPDRIEVRRPGGINEELTAATSSSPPDRGPTIRRTWTSPIRGSSTATRSWRSSTHPAP